jgi:hypothetical protein
MIDVSAILAPFVSEAVRDFGLWSLVPVLLGASVFEVRRTLLAKDDEIATLRRQIRDLQEKSLGDAREMIRIAEAGAAATASRSQSDQRIADLIEDLLRRQASQSLFRGRR